MLVKGATGVCESNLISVTHFTNWYLSDTSCETGIRWMPQDLTVEKSILVQVMAWCRQAKSHCLSQCWARSKSPHGINRPQYVKQIRWTSLDCISNPSWLWHLYCNQVHSSTPVVMNYFLRKHKNILAFSTLFQHSRYGKSSCRHIKNFLVFIGPFGFWPDFANIRYGYTQKFYQPY